MTNTVMSAYQVLSILDYLANRPINMRLMHEMIKLFKEEAEQQEKEVTTE